MYVYRILERGLPRALSDVSYPGSYLGAISCLLSFVPLKPNLVSISSCYSMLFQSLETSRLYDHGIQYPFIFGVYSLQEFVHPNVLETCYVCGLIDIFSQINYLVAFLSGCLRQPWAPQCTELTKVCFSVR